MRISASIFSFYILFLAVLPTLQAMDSLTKAEGCCGNFCHSPEQSPDPCNDNQPCKDLCNPLMSCGTCCGFVVATPQNILIVQPFAIVENNYIEVSPSQIVFSIWQPPKVF